MTSLLDRPVVVDKVSQASTRDESVSDAKRSGTPQGAGSYDGYPFEEWADLDEAQKAALAASRIGNVLAGQVSPGIAEKAIRDSRSVAMQAKDARDMRQVVQDAVNAALRWHQEEKDREAARKIEEAVRNSQGRPGDLMAEGSMLRQAQMHVHGQTRRYERSVTFDRPVAKFTCLNGDRLAKGGDMLTGCTVTDTEEQVIRTYDGKVKKVYTAKAIQT
jgi:hypothetical protein